MQVNELQARFVTSCARWTVHHPRICVFVAAMLVILAAAQLARLQINPTTYVLQKSHPVRVKDAEMHDVFTSTKATLAVVVVPKEGTVLRHDALRLVEELTQTFEGMNLVEDAERSRLEHYAVNADARRRVARILEDDIQRADYQSVTDLRDHLIQTWPDFSPRDAQFFEELLIFLDPIASVRSITNVENLRDEDDFLVISDLIEEIPRSDEALELLQREVVANELILGAYVSEDLRAANIRIELEVPSDYTEPVLRARKAVAVAIESVDDRFAVHIGGSAVVFNEMSAIIKQDNRRFFPLVLVVIMVTLALFFRSVEGVVLPLLVATASLVCTLALMPLFGLKLNMITSITPIFVMASAVADSIHFLSHFRRRLAHDAGIERRLAIVATYEKLYRPILLTTFTTMCGFLCLALTEVTYIREFGILVACGIGFAFLFTVTALPSLLALRKGEGDVKADDRARAHHRAIGVVADIISASWQRYRLAGLLAALGCGVLAAALTSRVEVDYETIAFYPEESALRSDDAAIRAHFPGVVPLSVRIDGANAGDMYSTDVRRYLGDVERTLRSSEDVGYVVSPNSYLNRMEHVLADPASPRRAQAMSEDLAAQYFLLYDNSSGKDIRDVVDEQYRNSRVVALVSTDRASVIRRLVDAVEAVTVPQGVKVSLAGHGSIVLAATEEIIDGQLKSLITTAFVVCAVMTVLFGGIRLGMVAVSPLVLTLLIGFGTMGLLDLDLNIATAMIAAIVFGIGIDYAIHYIESAKSSMANGHCLRDALSAASSATAQPVLVNSISLACGFAVLTVSVLKPLIYLGVFIAAAMILSAVLTLSLLPLLLSFSGETSLSTRGVNVGETLRDS